MFSHIKTVYRIYSYQPLSHASLCCPRLLQISRTALVHLFRVWWPVVLHFTVVWLYDILSYHFIQHFQFGFLPHLLASSHSPTLCIACLSIPAGYNPSCLCGVDRSLLSANHLSYLTSEILPLSAISQSMRCPSLQSNTFRVSLTALTPSSSSFICPPVCLQRISGQYSWCSLTYLFSAWNRCGQIIASCGPGDYAHAVYC